MLNSVAHTFKRKALEKLRALLARFDDEDDYESYEEGSSIYKPQELIMDHSCCSPLSNCGSVDCVIVEIGCADDQDRFLERLTTPTDPRDDKSWRFPTKSLKCFIILNSVKCVTSVVHHIDFHEVDGLGLTPLGLATLASSPELVKLFLEKGAPTDVRFTNSKSGHHQMRPLNYSLHLLCEYMIYYNVLLPEQSVYKMLITLCLPQLRSMLECVRLLAEKSEELGEEIYYYAKHGRLVELAVLLLVAGDKVNSASLVGKSSSLNGKECRNLDHCMTLREFIVFELGQLSALQVKLEFHRENGKLLSCCKEKQNLMMSALLLLEIFERAGKTIESYLKNQMPQEKIVQVLKEAGFCLEDKDIDMSHVVSFSWPSFLEMCDVPSIGKHAEQRYQLGSCLSSGDYASWRKNPTRLPQLFSGMKAKNNDFMRAALEKDLEFLCKQINLTDWASEKAVNLLLHKLQCPHLANVVDSIKSRLERYEGTWELICLYVREMSIVKAAALLHLGGKGSVGVEFAQTRECVENEMGKLIDKEVRQLGEFSADKEKLVFMLRLLEVFEKFGGTPCELIQRGKSSKLKKKDHPEIVRQLSVPDSSFPTSKSGIEWKWELARPYMYGKTLRPMHTLSFTGSRIGGGGVSSLLPVRTPDATKRLESRNWALLAGSVSRALKRV